MTKDIWLIADLHFSHKGACEFKSYDGIGKMRPWDNIEEMNEALVDNWNKVVKDNDKVYVLGDVAINRSGLKNLQRLKGNLCLIKGNHDIFQIKEYLPYFRDIRAYHVLEKFLLSHIPVHPNQKSRFSGCIHGHMHDHPMNDPWYLCVSVEQINFTPISFDDCKKIYEKRVDILK